MQFGSCPTCQTNIESERLNELVVVCQACGWSESKHTALLEKKIEKKFISCAVLFAVVVMLSFVHSLQWGSFFFEAIPLKAKQLIGIASPINLQRIAEICHHRQNSKCVEQAYRRLTQ